MGGTYEKLDGVIRLDHNMQGEKVKNESGRFVMEGDGGEEVKVEE